MDYEFSVCVTYTDVDGLKSRGATVYAPNEGTACIIALDLLRMDIDDYADMRATAMCTSVTEGDLHDLTGARQFIFNKLNKAVNDYDYNKFVKGYDTLRGYEPEVNSYGLISYKIDFMGMTVRVIFKNNFCSLSVNEIVYTGYSGKKIVAVANWSRLRYIR